MSQPTLFDPVQAARRSDPDTSHIAAERMRFRVGSHYAVILAALEVQGAHGGTHRELSQRTGLDPVAVDRRLPELRRAGYVVRLEAVRGGARVYVARRYA